METASIIAAAATLGALGIVCALMFYFADRKHEQLARQTDLITLIDDLLPQTQCGECGHMGCRPYATAIAQGEAINRCPPGGDATINALANLLDKPVIPLDGITKPDRIAFIREAECIGCTKCIQACPVDAIVGAAKLMHTVIADECTGCDLCVEPCPVDCIDMLPIERIPQPALYRQRFVAHNARLEREAHERELRRIERANRIEKKIDMHAITENAVTTAHTKPEAISASATLASVTDITPAAKTKQDEIREAIARAKAKKSGAQTQLPANTSDHDSTE